MYRIEYNNRPGHLATNSLTIIREELGPPLANTQEKPPEGNQLQLNFD